MNQPPRLFIVDDNAAARETLADMVCLQGYAVQFASSGQELLDKLDIWTPDVILLDVMMPGLDGFEVCRRIKAHEKWLHIPIILVTALDGTPNLVHGISSGADEFITKPVNGAELRARVRSMLRIKQQYDALAVMLQLREDLAHMLVHDMRTPLSTMMLYSDILLSEPDLPPHILQPLTIIEREIRRLNSFITDLLMMAKMEKNKMVLNQTMVNVADLVQQVCDSYRLAIREDRVVLCLELPEVVWPLSLDRGLFTRLVDNLVNNAIKYSPDRRKVTVRVSYPQLLSEGVGAGGKRPPQLRVQVIDEGPGIPPGQHEQIFEKYEIVALRKENIAQVGLGLAFCKLVAEAHNGRIFVTDNSPRGAVFTVEIW